MTTGERRFDLFLMTFALIGAAMLGGALLFYPWTANAAQVGGGFILGTVAAALLAQLVTCIVLELVP